jgi:hypothetical protein
MARAARLLALALAAAAAGCVYSPAGSCDTAADCGAGERCSAGVCVPPSSPGGIGGTEPTSFTSVLWSEPAGVPGTTFAVDAIGADAASGDVVVAGAVDAPFDFAPSFVETGGFVLRRAPDGAPRWASSLPTFGHGRLAVAVLPGGDVFFAGTAFEPTFLVTAHVPPAGGTLFVGVLAAATGDPVWRRALDATHATEAVVPVAVSVHGGDVVVAGTGSADLGCGDTGAGAFAAKLSGADGRCEWSRGLATRTLSDAELRDDGDVAVAGVCTPTGAFFEPEPGTTCAEGLFVATLSGTDGATIWAATASGAGAVTAVRDVAVAPDGRTTVLGDARGAVTFGGVTADFGDVVGSFAASYGPTGGAGGVLRPAEAPYAADPHAAAFWRGAYDRASRLWIAGTYRGQPVLAGTRFSACRAAGSPACEEAAFLARLDGDGVAVPWRVGSFLPLRAAPDAEGAAFLDDLVVFATTGSVAHALRFTGDVAVGAASSWASAGGDLGVLRVVP